MWFTSRRLIIAAVWFLAFKKRLILLVLHTSDRLILPRNIVENLIYHSFSKLQKKKKKKYELCRRIPKARPTFESFFARRGRSEPLCGDRKRASRQRVTRAIVDQSQALVAADSPVQLCC